MHWPFQLQDNVHATDNKCSRFWVKGLPILEWLSLINDFIHLHRSKRYGLWCVIAFPNGRMMKYFRPYLWKAINILFYVRYDEREYIVMRAKKVYYELNKSATKKNIILNHVFDVVSLVAYLMSWYNNEDKYIQHTLYNW